MQRIPGVDVARGLAVLGMITAHVAPGGAGDDWPWSATQVADGRSAALFVVLSGVSVALMSGGARPVAGTRRVQARTRLFTRAFLLLGLGAGLVVLGTPIAVILPTYAVLFAVATGLLGRTPRWLFAAAAVTAVVAPPVRLLLAAWLEAEPRPGSTYTDLLVGDFYPALVWVAYVLAGLGVGRLDLRDARVRRVMLATGAGLALAGYASAALLTRATDPDGVLHALVTSEPHSGSGVEVVASTGVSLGALALCLMAGDRLPRGAAPLAATGALALTAYCGHVVVIALLGPEAVWAPTAGTWLTFVAVTVVACTAWRAAWGRGPLERLLHGVSTRAADVAPDAPPPATTT